MPAPRQTGEFELRLLHKSRRRPYIGQASYDMPSGDIRQVAVYCHHGQIYFAAAAGDEELFTAGGLEREVQCALRAALREVHPELFVEVEEEAEAAR